MEQVFTSLADYGMAGIILMILLYYLNKLTDIHREERKEWQTANDKHVEKFSEVISESTKALTEMRSEIRENKCKVGN
jgi:hypothetical protein